MRGLGGGGGCHRTVSYQILFLLLFLSFFSFPLLSFHFFKPNMSLVYLKEKKEKEKKSVLHM